jgi:hypothetical protein
MSWQDAVQKIGVEPTYPFIQWINDGGILSPRSKHGGFAMPESEVAVAGDVPKGAVRAVARFRTADEAVYFAPEIRAAILAVRFTWTKDGVSVPQYVEGARGKAKALALIEGKNGPFVAVITLSGLASRDFLAAWKEHRARVRKATRAAGKEAPAAIFYLAIRAGDTQKMAQGSVRTPMTLSGEFDPDKDYVGDQALSLINWDEVKAWESGSAPAVNGDEPEPDHDEPEPQHPSPEPPTAPGPEPEHNLDWALKYPSPVGGKTFQKGTPLGELPSQAVQYIADRLADKHPDAARAARMILEHWAPEGDLPF